jgi:hypothetical protein
LLKLGFTVAQSTIAEYLSKRDNPSGQRWGTFLRNHAQQIAAMDLFLVPTIGFAQLYILVIVGLARRELVWINVTSPSQEQTVGFIFIAAWPRSRARLARVDRSRLDTGTRPSGSL